MQQSATLNWGFWAVLAAAFLWGTTGVAASYAPTVSPLAVGAVAMGGSGVLRVLLARKNIVLNWPLMHQQWRLLLLGGLAISIFPLSFYSSMHFAGITIGTVMSIGTAPLFTALLERLFDKKPLSMRWFVSFVLGVSGVLLLSLGESHGTVSANAQDENLRLLGIALGALAGLTYSLYSWLGKKLMNKGLDGQASMGMIFGVAAVFLLPTLYFSGDNILNNHINIVVLVYMVLVPMLLGHMLFGYGLKFIPASQAITLTLFEPVVAALFAVLLVGEMLAVTGWIGMGLIFACLALLSKSGD